MVNGGGICCTCGVGIGKYWNVWQAVCDPLSSFVVRYGVCVCVCNVHSSFSCIISSCSVSYGSHVGR